MIYLIAEHIASLLDGITFTFFLIAILQIRQERKKYVWVFEILLYISAEYLADFTILQTLLCIGICILFELVCLNGKLLQKLIWGIIPISITMLVSTITFNVFSIIFKCPISDFVTYGIPIRMILYCVCFMLRIVIMSLFIIIFKKEIVLRKIEWGLVSLLILANTFMLIGLFKVELELGLSNESQLQLMLISLLLIIVFVCCVYIVYRISSINRELLNNQFINLQLENQKNMLNSARETQDKTNVILHDMKHYVGIWSNMLQRGEYDSLNEKMRDFLDEISNAYCSVSYIKENELINSVLFSKAEQCRKNEIKCDYEITTNFDNELEMDIAIIISNLLDNAIRAEEQVKEKYIKVSIFERFEIKNLIVENAISQSVLTQNPKLSTTKNDKNNHGYGLISIRKMVEKYNGMIDISEEKDRFIVHICDLKSK